MLERLNDEAQRNPSAATPSIGNGAGESTGPSRAACQGTPTVFESQALTGWDFLLWVVILAVLGFGLGEYALYEPHEAHFAGVGREMCARNDWITPHLNGAPYLNKPPLFYWMIAASYKLFGVNEWAARLPLALTSWAGILLAFHWARKLWGPAAGRSAAVMLTVSAGWYLFSHQLLIDLLLSVLYFSSIYLLWKAILQPEKTNRWVAFYFSIALALLAKGLVGLLFPGAVFVLYVLWSRQWSLFKQCRPILGLGIMAALMAPWLILIEVRNPGFLYYALVNEHFKRALDSRWPRDYSNVQVSPLLYIGVLMVWLAPWCMVLPQILRFASNCVRQNPASTPASDPTRTAVMLLSLGAAMPLVLFLPMPSRLVYYNLPTVPFFMVLAAGWWAHAHLDALAVGRRWAATAFGLAGATCVIISFFLPDILGRVPILALVPQIIGYTPWLARMLGASFLGCSLFLVLRKPGWALGLCCAGFMFGALTNINSFAAFAEIRSAKHLVQMLQPVVGDECIWVSEGSREIGGSAGISYYLGHDADHSPRNVLVMADDPHRPPPTFPNLTLPYLLTHPELEKLWKSDKPVLFVTDFTRTDWRERTLNENADAPLLPADFYPVPLVFKGQQIGGNRRVYANAAAWERVKTLAASSDQ